MGPKKVVLCVGIALFAWALYPGYAAADYSFDLTTGNSAISGYSGPYALVDINLTTSTTATVTFTSLTQSGNIYLMGDSSSVDVNVNAGTWQISNIKGSNSGTGFNAFQLANNYTPPNAGQVDGFGNFNLTIDLFDGFKNSVDKLSFELTDTSGTWASAGAVLAANSGGWLAAAHVFPTSSPANGHSSASTTGYAAGQGQEVVSAVPLPGSVWVLGSGLIGLLGLKRKYLG